MRLTILSIAALAHLASLASAAPLSIPLEPSPNEDAVLLPRQIMCTNYPGTVAGHYIDKRSLDDDLSPHTDLLLPRANRIAWCRSHSTLHLSFAAGTRALLGGPPKTADLFAAVLHNISVRLSQGHGGARVGMAWVSLGTVAGEGVYVREAGQRGMTWGVVETAVQELQNYVAVRKDYRAVPVVGVKEGGKMVGLLALGGPRPS